MRLITRLLLITALLALPSVAHAQLQVSPFAGVNFGGDTTKTSGTAGVSATYWVFNWMGIEAEGAYSPMFFEQDGFLTSRTVTTLTGSFVFKAPMGGDRFQPYLAAGLGSLRPNLSEAGGLAVAKGNTLALTVGVGATGFINDHVGFRGDLRYLRGLRESDLDTNPFGLDFSKFSFWRPTAGLVVRF
ncbi:MAG: outer membrane beta-barrel protein [Anaerolineaceae bacterium]